MLINLSLSSALARLPHGLSLVEYCHNITNTRTSFAQSGVSPLSLGINLVGPLELYYKFYENLINNRNICWQREALGKNQYSRLGCAEGVLLLLLLASSIVLGFFVYRRKRRTTTMGTFGAGLSCRASWSMYLPSISICRSRWHKATEIEIKNI